MSNNGNGFWVIIALIAALSLVAIFDAAIASAWRLDERSCEGCS